jgi:hypothetical protein
MAISKEDFFKKISEPPARKVVTFAGTDYLLEAMTEATGCEYELMLANNGKWDYKKARRAMIALMLIDDAGNLIVDNESQLEQMPRALAGALYEACLELNNYEKNEVESLVKNSEPAAS